jgi:hypothetical protein
MNAVRECPNRQGAPICYNPDCDRGCVRNFRDMPTSDVVLSTLNGVTHPRSKPRVKPQWWARVLSRI